MFVKYIILPLWPPLSLSGRHIGRHGRCMFCPDRPRETAADLTFPSFSCSCQRHTVEKTNPHHFLCHCWGARPLHICRYPNIWRVELESRKGGKRRLLMCYYNSLISPCAAFIKRSFLPRKRVGFAPPRKNCKNPRGGVFRPQNGVEAVRITFCAFMCWPSPLTKDTLENSLSGNQLIYMLFCPAPWIFSLAQPRGTNAPPRTSLKSCIDKSIQQQGGEKWYSSQFYVNGMLGKTKF